MSDERLSTVHDAIREATMEPRRETGEMVAATYKVHPEVKQTASEICENNGTTLSAYLRWCCMLLIEDYYGAPKEEEKPEVPAEPPTQLIAGRKG